MNRQPLISIIVPCYNAARYIGALCESIRQQSFRDFEVLLLDDGSSDSSLEIMRSFRADPRFLIERNGNNRGVGACTAELLRRARGEFWANPGADDLIEPNFLAHRLALLEANPHASLVHGLARLVDENGEALNERQERFESMMDLPGITAGKRLLELLLMHNVVNTPSILVRMEATRTILEQFQDRWQFQDWFLWLLLASLDTEFVFDRNRLHAYRIHPQSLSNVAERGVRRSIETRLVPLVALSAGKDNSVVSRKAWERWRTPLYVLWLRRAVQFRVRNRLADEWMRIAIQAYYGEGSKPSTLVNELIKSGRAIATGTYRDYKARREIRFPAAGLAEVRDPALR